MTLGACITLVTSRSSFQFPSKAMFKYLLKFQCWTCKKREKNSKCDITIIDNKGTIFHAITTFYAMLKKSKKSTTQRICLYTCNFKSFALLVNFFEFSYNIHHLALGFFKSPESWRLLETTFLPSAAAAFCLFSYLVQRSYY